MDIRRKNMGNKMSEWRIYLTDKEMNDFGREHRYVHEMFYVVDNLIKDGYQGGICLGIAENFSGENMLSYHVNTGLDYENDTWFVTFELLYKRINGEETKLRGLDYTYKTKKAINIPNQMERFVRDLIKDGHLVFWDKEETE